ncbi:MAG: sugar phosphate isomerase [Firmicutes bacterium ZCTH02-B6]|nr:MAG: sugar phosphate isomerase [Firmicutes bacterium ZCTH02-B6]
MRFGVNTFIWESPLSTAHVEALADKAAQLGCDVLELACEDPALLDFPRVRDALAARGLEPVVCGAFGPGRDISSDDASARQGGVAYIRQLIDAAALVGAGIVCGPMYSQTGKARLLSDDARGAERRRAVSALKGLADYAAERGVRLALEPLNRFETDMINTVQQGMDFLAEVDHPAVGLHLDTFHMHIEEKSPAGAVRLAGDRLFHFHACENDRGVPGTGQVAWESIALALRETGYDGAVVIESFTPAVRSIAQAVCLWRPIAPDQDSIAREGLRFLRQLFVD